MTIEDYVSHSSDDTPTDDPCDDPELDVADWIDDNANHPPVPSSQ